MDWWAKLIAQRDEEEELERLARYKRAHEAYEGEFPLPLQVRQPDPGSQYARRVDDNVLLDWCGEVVDTGVSWLFKNDLTFDIEDTADPDGQAQTWLDSVWDANRRMVLLQKAAINGAICGHVFLRIVPTVINGVVADYRANPSAIRIVLVDPANVRVVWSPEDVDEVMAYDLTWEAMDPWGPLERRHVIAKDDQGRWTLVDMERREGEREYRMMNDPVVWPFTWPPMVDCQNLPCPNEYYGQADLTDTIIRLVKSANSRASDLSRMHRMHMHPQPYAKGMTNEQAALIKLGIDRLINIPNPDASIGLLEPGSPQSISLEFLRYLKEQVREASRIPEAAGGNLANAGSLSGVALNILFQPLMAKTESKRRLYGHLIVELSQRLLELAGFDSNMPLRVAWPDLLPADPKANAETATLKQSLGVSTDTLMAELGYDPETEATRREQSMLEAAQAFTQGKLMSGEPPLP